MVTPALFAAYPDAAALARADPERVEEIIRSTGFFRAKTRSIIGMAAALEERFGGQVPTELADLVTVPGVGRKTGNVVRSVAFGLPGLPVDTHVLRVTKRLGLTELERPGQGRAGTQRAHPPCRAGRLQPPGDPARAGDLYGPPACLFSLHPGRHLPVGLPGSQLGISTSTGPDMPHNLEKGRDYNVLRNRFPPPGSAKGRRWDPPPGRPADAGPSGSASVIPSPLHSSWPARYYSWCYRTPTRCYHFSHGDQTFGVVGR